MAKKEKIETNVIQSAPAVTYTFDQMKELIKQKKELEKAIKMIPKEDRAKLMPKRERLVTDNIKPLVSGIEKLLIQFKSNLEVEFKDTVSAEKPNGQKWLGYKLQGFRIHIQIATKD